MYYCNFDKEVYKGNHKSKNSFIIVDFKVIANIVQTTIEGKSEEVAKYLEEVHDREIPFLQYNDENSLSCVITLCYLSAGFPLVSAGFPTVSAGFPLIAARDDYDVIREEKVERAMWITYSNQSGKEIPPLFWN